MMPAVRGSMKPPARACCMCGHLPCSGCWLHLECGGEPAFWSTGCSLCNRGRLAHEQAVRGGTAKGVIACTPSLTLTDEAFSSAYMGLRDALMQ